MRYDHPAVAPGLLHPISWHSACAPSPPSSGGEGRGEGAQAPWLIKCIRRKAHDVGLIRNENPYFSKMLLAACERRKTRYSFASGLAVAVAAGAGLAAMIEWVGERTAGRRFGGVAAAGLAALLPLANLGLHWGANDRRQDRIAHHFVEDTLAGLPPRALLFTLDWQLCSPFLYLHHLEGLRPDVTMVNVNLVRRSWYVETYLPRVAPRLVVYDPVLTTSLPPHVSAASGMNAIAHAVEAMYAPDTSPAATAASTPDRPSRSAGR